MSTSHPTAHLWRRATAALCLLLTFASSVEAARVSTSYRGGVPPLAMGGMRFGSDQFRVRFDDTADTSRIENDYIQIELWDWLSDYVLGGVTLSRIGPDPDDRAGFSGLNPAGSSFGIVLGVRAPLVESLMDGMMSVDYVYSDAGANSETTDVDLEWWSATVRASVLIRVRRLGLQLGGSWREIDGEEHVRADTGNSTTDFEASGSTSALIGLDYLVGDSGHVGLQFERGDTDRFDLYFQRFF